MGYRTQGIFIAPWQRKVPWSFYCDQLMVIGVVITFLKHICMEENIFEQKVLKSPAWSALDAFPKKGLQIAICT